MSNDLDSSQIELDLDTGIQKELNLIDNLNISDIKSYLNEPDSSKIASNFVQIKDQEKKLDVKKKSSRKKRYKFTHLSRTQRLRIQNRRSNKQQTDITESQTDQPNEISIDESNESNATDDLDQDLTTNQYLIQGKQIELNRSDYNKYIVHGKWRPAEFFRLKQLDTATKCEFCGFNSKTHIENHSICYHCRNFAHVSLIKHHMFVCKDNNRGPNQRCKFKRLNNTTLQALDPDKFYCRFCHFSLIINTLPSLNRLQRYLVQFVNNRVIYVNSSSKKTMLWKTRLDLNKNDFSPAPAPPPIAPKTVEKPTRKPVELPKPISDKENTPIDTVNESLDLSYDEPQVKGPRVKHVSRSRPLYLQSVDNSSQKKSYRFKFYDELKIINEDKEPVFITWQSFTSDLKNEFTLSALPEKFKASLYKTYDFKFLEVSKTRNLNEVLISSEQIGRKNDISIERGEEKPFRAKIRKIGPRIEDQTTALKSVFEWDDYFERNHRISSNQNFRLSCLSQNGKDTYVPKNMSLVKATSQFDYDSVSSKRFTCKLNSYKDRFQFNLDSLNDKLKESINQLNTDLVSNDKNNNTTMSSNKNILINSNDFFQTNFDKTTSTNAYSSNSSSIPFPFVIPDYLVWDNNVINKYRDIPGTGFSVISYSPYSIKSLCFLCGSTSENDNKFYYCAVCCEPYHEFCLDDYQRPKKNSIILDWLCPACKYCEICHLITEDLQFCYKCGDSYHFDCLKKSSYPRKLTRKRKQWLCFKCFECKICFSKCVFYDKKSYSRMNNYDYSSCFKCYERYQLEKPFKCCNLMFSDSIQDTDHLEISKYLYQCRTCLNYFHYHCIGLSKIDIDLVILNQLRPECKCCQSEPNSLKQQISLIKANIFSDIVSSVQANISGVFTDDIVESLNDLFLNLKTGVETDDDLLKLKLMKQIEGRHSWLLNYMNETELGKRPKEKEVSRPMEDKMEVEEQKESVEAKVKSEQDIKKEQMLLEETKKNFIFSDLVKSPHEDHTYSIASNSIALALQASDIFDENLTLEKLNSFLERIKECQMNPTLQKIFNAHFAPINALNANSGQAATTLKACNKKSDRYDKITEPKTDFNNLDSIKNFSNVKHNAVDCRECMACRLIGDDDICGRLIPFDCYWIHLNCLLWSDDVLIDDCIIEQILSVFQKTKTTCSYCKRDGATITCDNKSCSLSYHFNCAYESKCLICEDLSQSQVDKRSKFQGFCIYCPEHATHQTEDDFLKESKFKKSIYIDVHDDNYRRKYSFPKFSLNPPKQKPYILIGSMQVENLGDLETLSDYKEYLCPVDYECSRLFWSTNELGKKCEYKCRIRLLNDYKKDLENKSDETTEQENSLNTSDLRFYLDNFSDEKDLDQKLNEDIGLLNQVDGLNDLNLNSGKSIIKYSNSNGGVAFIRPPQTTIRLPGLTNTCVSQNADKPKVLKLEANNLKFSNLKTTFVRVPNQSTATITNEYFKSPILNINQQKNEAILSPKSDRSDSSLNLNNSSYLVNPLQSSLDDMGQESSLNITEMTYNDSFKIFEPKDKQSKIKKEKIPKEKKPRKPKAESLSTKCTVAALLNAFNKVEKPSDILFNNSDVSNDYTSNNSNSSQIGFTAPDSQLSIKIPNDSFANFDYFMKKREKKYQTAPKVKNKLRDYFKDDFDFKVSFTNSLSSSIQNSSLPQSEQPTSSDGNTGPENSLHKNDYIDVKRIEKKIRKKEAKLMKSKVKIIALNEKKRMKIAKKMSIQSSLMDDQLFEQYSMSNVINSNNRCIVNNYYNDLDLEVSSNNNKLVFEITCEDGLKVISHDLNRAWKVIFDKIRKLRQEHKLKNISYKNLNGAQMLGLDSTAVIYMLEQLESIQFCPLYRTKYIHNQSTNDKWIINLNNCARTLKHKGPKKCLDPFYWLASEHRSLNFLNLSQRFDQKFFQAAKALQSMDICGSTKYRHLKDFSKSALVVKRSPIHGRGLFTLVDLSQGQMIIEYSGEIIRNEVCDKREKFYESKGIGCYMFRIDEFEVIDATTKGNQARFINHACEPNCISRVLVIGGHKHIVIFAQRAISRGEELTYDYKFPKEDVKIKCLCKSSRCRKYLN